MSAPRMRFTIPPAHLGVAVDDRGGEKRSFFIVFYATANFGSTSLAMISIDARIFSCSSVAKFMRKMM